MSAINSNNITVQGNWFGTNLRFDDLGNQGAGAGVAGNSTNIVFGGTQTPASNVFAYNRFGFFATPGASYRLIFNRFLFNDQPMSVPPSSASGVVTAALTTASQTILQGEVNGPPNQPFDVQVYWRPKSNSSDMNGGTPIGGFTLRTDFGGKGRIGVTFPAPLPTDSEVRLLIGDSFRTIGFSGGSNVVVQNPPPIAPDLELTKIGDASVGCGGEINYTITVTNKGSAAALYPLVEDSFSPRDCIEDVSFTTSQGIYNGPYFGSEYVSPGVIEPGKSVTITVKVKLKEDCGGTFTNKAAVFTNGGYDLFEGEPAASSDEVSTQIDCTRITGMSVQGKHVFVAGFGFEKGDKLDINGQLRKTNFIDENMLRAKKGKKSLFGCDPANPDRMNVIKVFRPGDPGAPVLDTQAFATCP
jgi:hypothetical protein